MHCSMHVCCQLINSTAFVFATQGGGLNIKPLQGIFQFPTIIMFVSGAGIAAARALIEGGEGSGLCFPRREAVVLYYSVRCGM